MNTILFIVLSAFMVYGLFSNIELARKYKGSKGYVNAYKALLNKEEGYRDTVQNYIDTCKSTCYLNKAYLLKLIIELEDEADTKETLNAINFQECFFTKRGKYSKKDADYNSDLFVWLMLVFSKARNKNKIEVMEELYKKVDYPELENRLERRIIYSLMNCFKDKNQEDLNVLNDVIEGNYSSYIYDKKMIGLYKKMVASSLAYFHELNDEFYQEDLRNFKHSLIGHEYMKDLHIIEAYPDEKDDPINSEE